MPTTFSARVFACCFAAGARARRAPPPRLLLHPATPECLCPSPLRLAASIPFAMALSTPLRFGLILCGHNCLQAFNAAMEIVTRECHPRCREPSSPIFPPTAPSSEYPATAMSRVSTFSRTVAVPHPCTLVTAKSIQPT